MVLAIAGAVLVVSSGPPARAAGSLSQTASELSGVVEDVAGQPVEAADVVVTRPDGSGRLTAITDASGWFALALPDLGPVRVLVVTSRGKRSIVTRVDPVAGHHVQLILQEGQREGQSEGQAEVASGAAVEQAIEQGTAPLRIVQTARAFAQPTVAAIDEGLALARDRDLAGVLATLPGTAPPAAPAGGPVIAGRALAEIPVTFEGFLLNDPIDGAAPAELPHALLGAVTIDRGPDLSVSLLAPRAQRNGMRLAGTAALATAARGADGLSRPAGATGGWSAEAGATAVRSDGRARAVVALAPGRSVWQADPESATAPRGRRRLSAPVLAWGSADLGGWRLDGGGLGTFMRTARGRTGRLLLPDAPGDEDRATWLLGTTARRQLAPGNNDLALRVGYLHAGRTSESAALQPLEQTGTRLTLAAAARVSGRFGVWHSLGLATGVDFERGDRRGDAPSRQPGAVLAGADAHATLPWVDLDERLLPTRSLEIQLGLRVGGGFFAGHTRQLDRADLDRSFSTNLLLAPRARLQWRPRQLDLAFFAAAGRRGVALPLDAVMGGAAGPRGDLPAPAEDALALGAFWQGDQVNLGLRAEARRSAAVIEDRFSPTSGQLELFSPAGAERRTRALMAEAELQLSSGLRAGASALIARQEGNHVGFIDEATGQLRPAGTGAFDGGDVEANRSGPLPFDRPYGLRGFLSGALPVGALPGVVARGILRGRLDAGTPRAATGRSAASGPGQVFLVERGSLGRTSPISSIDAAITVARNVGPRRLWLAIEAFNLTQHRPVVARDAAFTDAVIASAPAGRGLAGLSRLTDAQGSPVAQAAGFGRAVAYAEPLLVRALVGCDF
jgi:hypothetical protein